MSLLSIIIIMVVVAAILLAILFTFFHILILLLPAMIILVLVFWLWGWIYGKRHKNDLREIFSFSWADKQNAEKNHTERKRARDVTTKDVDD